MKNKYCIIMAGGIGSRFWPMSTADKPKQFLDGHRKNIIAANISSFYQNMP